MNYSRHFLFHRAAAAATNYDRSAGRWQNRMRGENEGIRHQWLKRSQRPIDL
jgi:hypothetical protein